VFLTVVFFLLETQPGDLPTVHRQPEIPPEQKAVLAERLGLDKPVGARYLAYMGNFFTGNLGNSLSQWPRPVSEMIIEALPARSCFPLPPLSRLLPGLCDREGAGVAPGKFTEHALTLGRRRPLLWCSTRGSLLMIWGFGFMLSEMGGLPVFPSTSSMSRTGSGRRSPNEVFMRMIIVAVLSMLAAAITTSSLAGGSRPGAASAQLRLPHRRVVPFVYFYMSPMRATPETSSTTPCCR
jgi:hypothetical protein